MSFSLEKLPPAQTYMKLGRLVDALGLTAESGSSCDIVDFIEAGTAVLSTCYQGYDIEAHQEYLKESLADEYHFAIAGDGQNESYGASYLLGSVAWRWLMVPYSPVRREEQGDYIDSMLEVIAASKAERGFGDYKGFLDAFTKHTMQLADTYTPEQGRYIVKTTRYVQYEIPLMKNANRPHKNESKKSYWSYLGTAIGSVALMSGYNVIPPPYQTDSDGAWQLPDESSDDEVL